MSVALVHEYMENIGGAERVFLQLMDLFPQADLFFLTYNSKSLPKETIVKIKQHKIKVSNLNHYRKITALVRMLAPKAIESFNFNNYDLVISNCNSYAKGIIVPTNTIHISYVHSPTRYLWDYNQQYIDEHANNFFIREIMRRLFFKQRQWDYIAAHRPDLLLANSRNVANRIKKYYGLNSKILYPSVDISRYAPTDYKSDYFLIVSRLSTYKKTDLVIDAFKQMPNLKLKIAGTGNELKKLKKQAKEADNIEFLGFVSDKQLPKLYAKARALIFPQLEDFGLTPIEAMASATPIIAYGRGGVLETVNTETGVFFQPQTAQALIKTIKEFLNKEHSFTRENLLSQANNFSEDRFKIKFMEIVDEIYSSSNSTKFSTNQVEKLPYSCSRLTERHQSFGQVTRDLDSRLRRNGINRENQ